MLISPDMPDSSSKPDLDLSFLYEIADGSDEFVVESIDMLLEQAPELLGLIGDAVDKHEWLPAATAAHKLKPSLGFFGMLASQGLIQEIEVLCKAGGQDPEQIAAKVKQANEMIGDTLNELQRIKAEKS